MRSGPSEAAAWGQMEINVSLRSAVALNSFTNLLSGEVGKLPLDRKWRAGVSPDVLDRNNPGAPVLLNSNANNSMDM